MSKKERGITLIALIITIIILIILAAIGIRSVIGDHGLFQMAQEAAEKTRIEGYREELVEIGAVLAEKQVFDDIEGREYLEKFQEKVEESEQFKNKRSAEIIEGEDGKEEKLRIVTQEGYVFDVTEEEVTYLGKTGEKGLEPLPDILDGSIEIDAEPTYWTNDKVIISIKINENMKEKLKGLIIEYTTDETGKTGWQEYDENNKPEMTTNGTIIARLKNSIGDKSKYTATETITNIDKIDPDKPSIALQGTLGDNNYYKSNVTATITAGQDNDSGADKIKYVVTGSQSINETTTDSGTITIPIEITQDGSSTITAYTIDKAGNESEPITQIINKDTELPTINLTQANTEAREYTKLINVDISDTISGVSMKKYANREQNTQYFSQNGINLENSFTAKTADSETKSGMPPSYIYTVYAKDMAGNEACKTIEVKNLLIDSKITALNGINHLEPQGSTRVPCEYDKNTGRLTLHTASVYGPYWEIPIGNYEITYVGENLSNCTFRAYTTYPSAKEHSCSVQSKTDTTVITRVQVFAINSDDPNYAGRVEFTMATPSNTTVYLDYIRIKELP